MGERAYRWLMVLLPQELRQLYGEGLLATVRDRRAALGARNAFSFWLREVCDLVVSAGRAHLASLSKPASRQGLRSDQAPAGRYYSSAPAQRIDTMRQDLRYALRSLSRNLSFTLASILTLALGIGATTALFSVVHAVVLRPLPFNEPDRLMRVHQVRKAEPETVVEVSHLDFTEWRNAQGPFTDLAAYATSAGGLVVDFGGGDEPGLERVPGKIVTWNLFSLLGTKPLLGRLPSAKDDVAGAAPMAWISEHLWRGRLASDPQVIGRRVEVSGTPTMIAGVLPADFEYPPAAKMWLMVGPSVPPTFLGGRSPGYLNLIGRLRPEATPESAVAELDSILDHATNPFIPQEAHTTSSLEPLKGTLLGGTRRPLLLLFACAVVVLLIACANVASLQVARGLTRHRELAIRGALGAGAGRLVRLALVESGLLALLGGLGGLALAYWGLGALLAATPRALFRGEAVSLDRPVQVFTTFLVLVVAFAAGLLPARQGLRARLTAGLRQGGRHATGHLPGRRLMAALVASQVTLAVLLLLAAGLLVQSFAHLWRLDAGFDRQQVLTVQLPLNGERYSDVGAVRQLYDELTERLAGQPGIDSAAGVLLRPLHSVDGFDAPFTIEGRSPEEQQRYPFLNYEAITPDYFETLGIPLLEGRAFDSADREEASPVVLVSQATAQRFWPRESPVGQRIKWGAPSSNGPWATVVGVVGSARYRQIDKVSLDVYVPYGQSPWPLRHLAIRGPAPSAATLATLRGVLQEVDSSLEILGAATTRELVSKALAGPRFTTLLIGLFGVLALVLGAVGIYGLLAYSLTTRQRELGIRSAMGATAWDLVRLALAGALRPVLLGTALGLFLGLMLGHLLESLLFGIAARDPLTFAAVPLLLFAFALATLLRPALRAGHADPMAVLRAE